MDRLSTEEALRALVDASHELHLWGLQVRPGCKPTKAEAMHSIEVWGAFRRALRSAQAVLAEEIS